MKKARNVFIIIAILFMVAGIGISVAAAATMDFNFTTMGDDYVQEGKDYESDYAKLTLDVLNRDIEIIKSQDDNIHFSYSQGKKSTLEFAENTTDNELKLTEKDNRQWYDYIFGFSFPTKLTIALPDKSSVQIYINNKNGKIAVSDLEINSSVEFISQNGEINLSNSTVTGNLSAETSNGTIELNSLDLLNGEFKTSNGKYYVNNVTTQKDLNLKTSNGKIEAYNVKSNQVNFKSSNGEIRFENIDVSTAISGETSNGSISGTLVGTEGDFTFDADTTLGDVNVPSNEPKELGSSGNSNSDKLMDWLFDEVITQKTAYFKTSNGSIDVSYAE